MTLSKSLLPLFAALALLGACATADTYPLSGEQCGPTDPVKNLDANDCMPPV